VQLFDIHKHFSSSLLISSSMSLHLQSVIYHNAVTNNCPLPPSASLSELLGELFQQLKVTLATHQINHSFGSLTKVLTCGLLSLHKISCGLHVNDSFLHKFSAEINKHLFAFSHKKHFVVDEAGLQFRSAVAKILLSVVFRLQHTIAMQCFDSFIHICIRGIGDYQAEVRSLLVQAFRVLVPLAPLAQSLLVSQNVPIASTAGTSSSSSSTTTSSSPNFIRDLFVKSGHCNLLQSQDQDDQKILQIVRGLLAAPSKSENVANTELREYQWEGISWWTSLRRIGLGGVLADDM
jgi:hypothetical protein